MQCNGNFKQWFNIFLIISKAWQGYESKAYGVSNHNLKLQSKKLSRTRDIPNFPTQGWADTAFCTRKRSEIYTCSPRWHGRWVNLFHIPSSRHWWGSKLACAVDEHHITIHFQVECFSFPILSRSTEPLALREVYETFVDPMGDNLVYQTRKPDSIR